MQAIEGSWALVAAELGGRELPDAVTETMTLVLRGDRYTLKSAGPDDAGGVRFDPGQEPKRLDVTGDDGPNAGKSFPAIYELDGDTLRICYDLAGRERPTAFASAPGTLQFLALYKRKREG